MRSKPRTVDAPLFGAVDVGWWFAIGFSLGVRCMLKTQWFAMVARIKLRQWFLGFVSWVVGAILMVVRTGRQRGCDDIVEVRW